MCNMSMFITQIVLYDIKKSQPQNFNIHALVNVKHHKKLLSSSIDLGKASKQQVLYMSSDFPTPPITNIFNLKTLPNE